jgi:outer membrane protein assembly factor BamE
MTSIRARRAGAHQIALLVAVAGALAGCQSLQSSDNFLGLLTPYRVEVVQGNVITSEQIALAKPGLTRAQVRDALGSPLLADPFHADRWDYVFTIRRQGAPAQLRRVVVHFKNDALESIEGGADLPSEKEFVASIDTDRRERTAPSLMLSEEQIKALPVPVRPAPAEPAPPVPNRTYPPLEPAS